MARGRPNHAERLVLEYVEAKSDRTLDLRLDAPGIAALAVKRGMEPVRLKSVVERMQQKQLLHILQRGRYVLSREQTPSRTARFDELDPIADAVLRRLNMEYYVSWHSALWHHGLIDQQSRRIYVAVTARKRPVQVGAASIKFVTVAERKFFGRVEVDDFEWPVWMATPEKALIDSFDQPHLAAPVPVIATALRNGHREGTVDPEQLVQDAVRFDSPSLNRRLGFFMDLLEIPGSDPLALRVGRTYAVPLAPGQGPAPKQERHPVNRRWRVYEDPAIVGTALELK